MDSANSDSMQSSSGDEEYDSRTDTISPYLNPSLNFGSIISNPPPPPPPQQPLSSHQSHPPTFFDPHQSHNLGAFSHPNPNANSLYNLDSVWSTRGVLRSDIDQPIYADLGNLTGGLSSSSSSSLSSSLSSSTQSLLGIQGTTHQSQFPSSSSMALPSVDENGGRSASHQTNPVAKNTRKRTRASRRAPTTVLTTDTSNFRQMVQEFTGIPAPPFSAASPYSRRLDLFATGSTLRSGHLDSLGPLYPFKPSAQKLQQQQQQPSLPFVSSSSSSPSLLNSTMIDSIPPITTNNAITTTSIAGPSNNFSSTTTSSYQMIHPMLNMQNPVFTFQSILQSSLKYPLPNAPIFSSKSHQPSSEVPSLDELGMTHEHVNPNNLSGFPSHGNSDGTQVGNNNNLSMWRGHEEPPNDGGQQQQQQQHQQHLGSFDGNNGDSSQHYNLNCSGSTSDFHPDKCLENVSSRNEGTVDSWICPSDSDLCSNKQYA